MLLNRVAVALSDVLVPYTLKALRTDPALASCIMVTTVTDGAGFFFSSAWPPSPCNGGLLDDEITHRTSLV